MKSKDEKMLEEAYRIVCERLGVSQEVSDAASKLIEELESYLMKLQEFEQGFDAGDYFEFTTTVLEQRIVVVGDVDRRDFVKRYRHAIFTSDDVTLVLACVGTSRKGNETILGMIYSLTDKVTYEKFVEIFKKQKPLLLPVLEHELKHLFDKKIDSKIDWKKAINSTNLKGISFLRGPNDKPSDTKYIPLRKFLDRLQVFVNGLTSMIYNIQETEISVFANEISREIREKMQSKYLTPAQFKAMFDETRVGKKIQFARSVPSQLQWFEENFNQLKQIYSALQERAEEHDIKLFLRELNFMSNEEHNIFDFLTSKNFKEGLRDFLKSRRDPVGNRLQKETCNLILLHLDTIEKDVEMYINLNKKLARMYDLFAPPKTTKY